MTSRNFCLSPKDRLIFDFLLKNKIASSQVMRKYLFPEIQQSGMDKRLRKLLKVKYIERSSFINSNYKLSFYYYLSSKAFSLFDFEEVSMKGLKLKSEKIYHDLGLIDIRYQIEGLKEVSRVYSENDLIYAYEMDSKESFKELKSARSDAAISFKWKGKEDLVALEYEASLKSEKRYDEVFSRYYKMKAVKGVLYVCQNEKLLKKLMTIENKYNDSDRAIIYYTTLENVFLNSHEVLFTNRFGQKFLPLLEHKD